MNYKDLLNRRNAIIAAVAVAVIGFLVIQEPYGIPYNGLLSRILYGEIFYTDRCINNSNDDWFCGVDIPYRWLLVVVAAVIAGALMAPRKKSR